MAIMRDSIMAYSQSPSHFNCANPVVSGNLYSKIVNLKFCGETADDSPFIAVSDGSDNHRAANLKLAEVHSTLLEGSTTISYRDMERIGAKHHLSIPSTFMDFINFLGLFGITVLLPFFCFAPAGLMYRCTYAKIFMCILYLVPDYGTNRGYRVVPR